MVLKLCTFLIVCSVACARGPIHSKLLYNKKAPSFENKIYGTVFPHKESNPIDDSAVNTGDGQTHDVTSAEYDDDNKPVIETTTTGESYNSVTDNDIVIQCPEGQSSFPSNELNNIIDFFATQMNLLDSINGSYFELAVTLRDQNVKSLDDYLAKFKNRPKHVDHLLDDLAQTRLESVEPLVKKVISKRSESNSLQGIYKQQKLNSDIYLAKFEKSKNICALNCGTTELDSIMRKRSVVSQRTSPSNEIYCASIKDVKEKVESALTQFVNDYAEILQNSVKNIHNSYDENIKTLKVNLKEAAVQEFGTTMYDVLSLQDDYNHFLSLLRGESGIDKVESQLSAIRKNNLQIDYKIEELKNDAEKYRVHCLGCNDKVNLRVRRDVLQAYEPPTEPSNDLLDDLLTAYMNGIKSQFENEQAKLFQDLNDTISDKDSFVQNALANLQPIKIEIRENLEKEEKELNDLKSLQPESVMVDLSTLNEDSVKLQKVLDNVLTYIHNIIV